jgi:hypothetical protein
MRYLFGGRSTGGTSSTAFPVSQYTHLSSENSASLDRSVRGMLEKSESRAGSWKNRSPSYSGDEEDGGFDGDVELRFPPSDQDHGKKDRDSNDKDVTNGSPILQAPAGFSSASHKRNKLSASSSSDHPPRHHSPITVTTNNRNTSSNLNSSSKDSQKANQGQRSNYMSNPAVNLKLSDKDDEI